MKLSETVEKLHSARAAHKAWVSRAEALVEGIPLDKSQVPMFSTDCAFGKWYYGDGQQLSQLPGFKEMEKPHDELHKVYMRIFKLLFEEPDSSALGRLFGTVRREKAKHIAEAAAMLPELRDLSDKMTNLLEALEKNLLKLAQKHQVENQRNTPSDDVIGLLEKMEKEIL